MTEAKAFKRQAANQIKAFKSELDNVQAKLQRISEELSYRKWGRVQASVKAQRALAEASIVKGVKEEAKAKCTMIHSKLVAGRLESTL
ncbi:hypothetical protein ACLOJK_006307 [Asimina triloba]